MSYCHIFPWQTSRFLIAAGVTCSKYLNSMTVDRCTGWRRLLIRKCKLLIIIYLTYSKYFNQVYASSSSFTELFNETWSITIAFHNKRSPCCGLGSHSTRIMKLLDTKRHSMIHWIISQHSRLAHTRLISPHTPNIIILFTSSLIIYGQAMSRDQAVAGLIMQKTGQASQSLTLLWNDADHTQTEWPVVT